MMIKLYTALFILIFPSLTYSQVIMHSAITTTGRPLINGGIMLSGATGQIAFSRFATNGIILREGIIQPDITNFTTSLPPVLYNSSLQFFPNPSTEKLFIQSDDNFNHYEIYNISGALVGAGNILNNAIDINNLNPGSFYIRCNKNSGSFSNLSKFIKL